MNPILKTALTYLVNTDKLIYSYGGNTFLRNGELTDAKHDGRGRIDCSTLVLLSLQGITYDQSPYAAGEPDSFFDMPCLWRAETLMTVREALAERSDRATDLSRAYGMARYCRESGLEITERENLKPGDLVFYRAGKSVYEKYVQYGAFLAVSHVGIVTEDPDMIINATGSSDEKRNAVRDAVRLSKIGVKGGPVLAARIITHDI